MNVRFGDAAWEEVQEIAERYDQFDPAVKDAFLDELESGLASIRDKPHSYEKLATRRSGFIVRHRPAHAVPLQADL